MAFRNLSSYCRIGHLLAKPRLNAMGRPTANSSPPIMSECARCQLRYTSRDDRKPPPAKCGSHFKSAPCDQKSKATKTVIRQANPKPLPVEEQEFELKSPDACCGNACKYALPRFDLLYYRRSDKTHRDYQQTWAECPELVRKPKLMCCYESIKFPQWERRPRMERPQTACKPPVCTNTKSSCPNLRMPRCGKARRPPKCHVNREPKDCVKHKAPHPSFSECSRDKPKPLRPLECKCLALPTMCEVWAQYHKVRAIKKVQ